MPNDGGSNLCTCSTHQAGPVGDKYWYVPKPRIHAKIKARQPGGHAEDVVCVVRPTGEQPVGKQDGE